MAAPSPRFDESLLDDAAALRDADPLLRHLAEAGARVRRESGEAADAVAEAVASWQGESSPRAVVAAGPDSRLLRAVLEPACPVPFVAWPGPGLPGWAGGLDLVVVLAPVGQDRGTAATVAEAVRRGCRVVVACPPRSLVAEHAAGRDSCLLPTATGDQLATAVVVLGFLDQVRLGPATDAEDVARALDDVAVACSPHRDLSVNPAKTAAIGLADSLPVVWGGSVLAARAGRRVAEAVRRSTGRGALAGDAEHLLPVVRSAAPRDVFADPFADPVGGDTRGDTQGDTGRDDRRPVLLVLDDGAQDPSVREQQGELRAAAAERDVRVETLSATASSEVARYAALLSQGRYVAAYLGVGLGLPH